MELRYLDEHQVTIWKEAGAERSRCQIGDELCVLEARFARCFPLSNTEQFVSICDGSGAELGIVREPAKLAVESRELLEAELDRRYFTPTILRIVTLKQEASMWRWGVETQRGPIEFYLRGVRDSVHEVAPGRWQIYSVDGQRYELRNYDSLDARTQNLFESLF